MYETLVSNTNLYAATVVTSTEGVYGTTGVCVVLNNINFILYGFNALVVLVVFMFFFLCIQKLML